MRIPSITVPHVTSIPDNTATHIAANTIAREVTDIA
jgi:hypothetical protein